jgi:ribosomal-protein-alanine N-acetyltransferase
METTNSIIITSDLKLRKPIESDIQRRLELGRYREFIKMVGGSLKQLKPYKKSDAIAWFKKESAHPYSFVIEYKGNMIGICRIQKKNDQLGRYSIGLYDRDLLAKGIGTTVTKAMVSFGFKTLHLMAIDLMVLTINVRAISCYEKSGFKTVKTLKSHHEVDGVVYDDLIMLMANEKRLTDIPVIDLGDIVLRPIRQSDYMDMYDYGKDDQVTKYLAWDSYSSVLEAKQSVEKVFLTRPSNGVPSAYAIVHKNDRKMIGTCDIFKVNWLTLTGEIGYVIHRDYWGKGIMTKACKAVIRFGFSQLGLKTIEIGHDVNNIGSQRVIEKCGFEFVKESYVEHLKMRGRFYKLERSSF